MSGSDPEPAPELSVIIPARDAATELADTLAGLAAQRDAPSHEVIVVDDGSRDASADLAARHPVVADVVRLAAGGGPARARNAGVDVARAAKLAFLDADCVPAPGWLAAGARALQHADLVLGETRPRTDQPLGPFDRTLSVRGVSPLYESANLFVRRELWQRLGGFESWLGPRRGKELGEDVWFGWRASRAGARIAASPDALAHHANHPGTAGTFVTERWRLRFFPALARRIPELRGALFHRRVFLNRRQERFDLALAALLIGVRGGRREAAALVLPYALELTRDLREPHGARKVLVRPAADAVGLVALLAGSVRYRSLVL